MEEAIARYGAPDVFNTNRGVQFTSQAFTDALKAHASRWKTRASWLDNVYVEHLWRSLKQEWDLPTFFYCQYLAFPASWHCRFTLSSPDTT